MIEFFRKLWRDRRGNALVIAGAALPLIVGSAGLASDTIQWALWKRQLQRAADSAAIAGVYAEMQGKPVGDCRTRERGQRTAGQHATFARTTDYRHRRLPAR